MQEQQNPLHNNVKDLCLAMKELGLLDLEINFGRFEDGTINYFGRADNGTTLDVCVGIKSMDDLADLDVSLEETLESFTHHKHLRVIVAKSGEEGILYFDSYIDRDALAARTKELAAYVEVASQERIENVDRAHFLTPVHFDPSKDFRINAMVKLTDIGAIATVSCSDGSEYDITINEQTSALNITRFIKDVFGNAGYMESRDKATNILLAVLEYVVSR